MVDRGTTKVAGWSLIEATSRRTPFDPTNAWIATPPPFITVNTDGSIIDDKGRWGVMIKEFDGTAIKGAAGSFDSKSITILELKAVEIGLVLADKINRKKAFIVTDSIIVLYYLTGYTTLTWDSKNLVRRIREHMGKMDDCVIRFNFRETNGVADYLAGLHVGVDWVEFTPSSFAQDLKDIIRRESMGHVYFILS
ncbi:hypothetical protein GIB67_030132 [Kingdonia uniflora]|uniref:RNase H type-1 domain-containing protein n=1 Tax=Kingdonia uniflora TaxID=39325 RepID=A0A7J7LC74_9MAGN|nr:hypothetical protein GIB67_030132 [Kingdonia uniflora]